MSNCRYCLKPIPNQDVRIAGMHMSCHDEEIEVFKVCIEGTCYYDETKPEELSEASVELVKVPRGHYLTMKEFDGF